MGLLENFTNMARSLFLLDSSALERKGIEYQTLTWRPFLPMKCVFLFATLLVDAITLLTDEEIEVDRRNGTLSFARRWLSSGTHCGDWRCVGCCTHGKMDKLDQSPATLSLCRVTAASKGLYRNCLLQVSEPSGGTNSHLLFTENSHRGAKEPTQEDQHQSLRCWSVPG